VLYREVDDAGIDPMTTGGAGGYLWAGRVPGPRTEAEAAVLEHAELRARTTYNVDHPVYWGGKITGYLFFKSLAAGAFLAAALAWWTGGGAAAGAGIPGLVLVALGFLAVTTAALVADLKRPERFYTILTRPNWDSWLARGSFLLAGYGLALVACLGLLLIGTAGPLLQAVLGATALLAVLSAAYTGWLFGQARGRVLWMRRGLWMHLVVQALVAGNAVALLAGPWLGLGHRSTLFRLALSGALVLHAAFIGLEGRAAPPRRRAEYERTAKLITGGPYTRAHVLGGLVLGILVPGALLILPASPLAWGAAGLAAVAGLWIEESLLVQAGQALPIS